MPYSRMSFVAKEVGGDATIARALGATIQVLIPQLAQRWALATLPSGQLCFLQADVFANLGPVAPETLHLFALPNAG